MTIAVVLVVQAWAVVWGTVASSPVAADGGPAVHVEHVGPVHVAQPGDTLWSIAAAHRGADSRSDEIDALLALNGGTVILAGQAVLLP